MQKLNDSVVISIDPGNSGTKVTVNGERFSIPKMTVKKIGNEFDSFSALDGIYEVTGKTGNYLCGPNIAALVDENKDFHARFGKGADQNSNFSYLGTEPFKANALAALTIALVRAEENKLLKLDQLDKANLRIVVTLPHDVLLDKERVRAVGESLVGLQEYHFTGEVNGKSIDRDINIDIKKNDDKFMIISQAIACLFGYITDEDGNEIDSLNDSYPTIIVDGGYYTNGDLSINKTKAVSGAESNTHYSMIVIHQRCADKINSLYPGLELKYFDVEKIFEEEKGMLTIGKRISKKGINETFDCNAILEETTHEVFEEYLQHLEQKYNDFEKHKQILFGGGTGEIYYNLMLERTKDYPNIKIGLIKYMLDGTEVTPREAISAGAYKMVLNRM